MPARVRRKAPEVSSVDVSAALPEPGVREFGSGQGVLPLLGEGAE